MWDYVHHRSLSSSRCESDRARFTPDSELAWFIAS